MNFIKISSRQKKKQKENKLPDETTILKFIKRLKTSTKKNKNKRENFHPN